MSFKETGLSGEIDKKEGIDVKDALETGSNDLEQVTSMAVGQQTGMYLCFPEMGRQLSHTEKIF